jgi:hypothetical protein
MLGEIALVMALSAEPDLKPPVPVRPIEITSRRPPFRDRHPRVYCVYRAGRKVCLALKPFLDVTAATAQVVTPFLLK